MSSPSSPRLKTLRRASNDQLPPFRLMDRDCDIIKAVYEYRALTTPQIETLLFPPKTPTATYGKKTRCQLRLKLLYHHGYLWRDEIPTKRTEGRKPLVYRIDKKAVELLPDLLDVEPEDIEWRPQDNTVSDPYLTHLLTTNDVRVALTVAAQIHGFTLKTWRDDYTLKQDHANEKVTVTGPRGGKMQVAIVPDGYFHLWTGEKNLHHFLEIDLRTVVGEYSTWGRKDWARKIRTYIAYFDSGQYQKRYKARNARILTVTTSERRLQTLKRITEDAKGKIRFWFTTLDQVTPHTVFTDPIWQVATKDGQHRLII